MSAPVSLADWLGFLEARNRDAIVLGLERVAVLRDRLDLRPGFPLISVGGTNGKGSVCAYLEAVLLAAGYRVGCYTSPHLLRYNERVRIDGREASDADLVAALDAVEAARGDIALTYFEQGTLAAMWLFQRAGVDVAVLEVGMGGRLDAVNAWDADCAVISGVDLDHQPFLGDTREAIGFEKAGLFRSGRPAICGDRAPPARLLAHAAGIGARLLRIGADFAPESHAEVWRLAVAGQIYTALPRPAMAGRHQYDNAACALAALACLRERLPVHVKAVRAGLAHARQPGRFQIVGRQPLRVLDVAHNPQSARALADNLAALPPGGRVHAVCAMLADKDIDGVLSALAAHVTHWHIAGLEPPRGLDARSLGERVRRFAPDFSTYARVAEAWREACRQAGAADTILAFGSFHTVAKVLAENDIHG